MSDVLRNATAEDLERWAKVLDDAAMSIAFYGEQPDDAYFGLAALARAVAKAERQSNGDPWVARHSTIGRGFRIHNDKGLGQHPALPAALASLLEDTDNG